MVRGRMRARVRTAVLAACMLLAMMAVGAQARLARSASAGTSGAHAYVRTQAHAAEHFACSTPASVHRPCYFSTPSDDVHCLWTPSPNSVTCELLSSRHAYRLHPTGHSKTVHVALARRGETLPSNQILTFPERLSCQATKTAMTCNQDEGFGEFKLSPHGSHAA
jgi:hypothetical protein